MMHVYSPPPALSGLLPGAELIPESVESLDGIVQRLLQKRPSARFSSMRAVADALEKEVDLLLVQRGEKAILSTTLQKRLRARGAGTSQSVNPVAPAGVAGQGQVQGQRQGQGQEVAARAPGRGSLRARPRLLAALALLGVAGLGGGYLALSYLAPAGLHRQTPPARLEAAELRRAALAALETALQQGPADARVLALRTLGQTGDVDLSSKITPWLSNADPHVQAAAATALGDLGSREAVSTLLARVENSESAGLMAAVATALHRLGEPRGRLVLEDLLEGPDREARLRAALALAPERAPQALALLRAAVDGTRDEIGDELYAAALAALAQAGDADALRRLRAALTEPAPASAPRIAPLHAAALLYALDDAEGESYLRARSQPPARGPDGGLPAPLRAAQVRAASLLAGPERPVLGALFRQFLDDRDARRGDPAARVAAVRGLGALGLAADGGRLVALSLPGPGTDDDPALRLSAAAAILDLIRLWPATLTARSLAWARAGLGDGDARVREAAVAVLGDSPAVPAVQLLSGRLSDAETPVRIAAARALGRHGDAAALAALREALHDGDGAVRIEALRALSRLIESLLRDGTNIQAADVAEWCQEPLQRGDSREQLLVRSLLVRLGDSGQITDILPFRSAADPRVRRLLVEQIPSRPDVLQDALSDPDPDVRLIAARRLAVRGDARARPVLVAALQKGGPDAIAAYGLLRRLGDTQPPPPGLDEPLRTGGTESRAAAVDALVYLPDELAVPRLLTAARDVAPPVRRRAAEVAASLRPAEDSVASPGTLVLRRLSSDPDASVRARAQAALGRTRPPG